MPDRYRDRLKQAQWTWNERHDRNSGHYKEATESRSAKRAAKNEDRKEIETDTINAYPLTWDDLDDYDDFSDWCTDVTVEPLRVPLIQISRFRQVRRYPMYEGQSQSQGKRT